MGSEHAKRAPAVRGSSWVGLCGGFLPTRKNGSVRWRSKHSFVGSRFRKGHAPNSGTSIWPPYASVFAQRRDARNRKHGSFTERKRRADIAPMVNSDRARSAEI